MGHKSACRQIQRIHIHSHTRFLNTRSEHWKSRVSQEMNYHFALMVLFARVWDSVFTRTGMGTLDELVIQQHMIVRIR